MIPFPEKKYKTIYADPPWRYRNESPPCLPEKQPDTCKIEYYYQTMSLEGIKNLPIKTICEKDCILFLWATTPAIQEALEVVKAWGFNYKTMITWEKTNKDCMGYWFRVCTEHLIVATKGNIKSFRRMERTLYSSPRGRHSEKPDYFRKLISGLNFNPKIELFARPEKDLFGEKTEGWDVWGNEV